MATATAVVVPADAVPATYEITVIERRGDETTNVATYQGQAEPAAAVLRAAAAQILPMTITVDHTFRFGTDDGDPMPGEDTDDGRFLAAVVARVGKAITPSTQWKLIEAIRAERPDGTIDPTDHELLDAIACRSGYPRGRVRLIIARVVASAVLVERDGVEAHPAIAAELPQLIADAPALAMGSLADAVSAAIRTGRAR